MIAHFEIPAHDEFLGGRLRNADEKLRTIYAIQYVLRYFNEPKDKLFVDKLKTELDHLQQRVP